MFPLKWSSDTILLHSFSKWLFVIKTLISIMASISAHLERKHSTPNKTRFRLERSVFFEHDVCCMSRNESMLQRAQHACLMLSDLSSGPVFSMQKVEQQVRLTHRFGLLNNHGFSYVIHWLCYMIYIFIL